LLLAAVADLALVSTVLGRSSIAITADTFSHLPEGVAKGAAERASALVPARQPATDADKVPTERVSEMAQPRKPEPRRSRLRKSNPGPSHCERERF
jgi:hypothetical protein